MPQAIAASPSTLVITRLFSIPPERVFKAWTNAGQLARWFSPTDDYVVKAEVDLRVGGTYRIEMHHNAGQVHTVFGVYQEIVAPERLSFTWRWEGSTAPDTLVTVDFKPLGNSTEVTTTHQKFSDVETRDKHDHGWVGCLARLQRMIASEA